MVYLMKSIEDELKNELKDNWFTASISANNFIVLAYFNLFKQQTCMEFKNYEIL